jgi:peptide methionine sulfoxide reductase MsrA
VLRPDGHNEAVLVVSIRDDLLRGALRTFWESHDPTQGMSRATTSARSTGRDLRLHPEQRAAAEASKRAYGDALAAGATDP